MALDSGAAGRHARTLTRLCRPGMQLGVGTLWATVAQPDRFLWRSGRAVPTPARASLHGSLLAEVFASDVACERRAVVLAGPPGAGKTGMLSQVLWSEGQDLAMWRVADADMFKELVLRAEIEAGTFEALKPPVVRELEDAGERFYPMEMSALVHEESSLLAHSARDIALSRGENLVVDTVLGGRDSAILLGRELFAAGYSVMVAEVEATESMSTAKVRDRWLGGWLACEAGHPDAPPFGPRWVPSEYPRSLFRVGQEESVCRENALALADALFDGRSPVRKLVFFEATMHAPIQSGAWVRDDPCGVLRPQSDEERALESMSYRDMEMAALLPAPSSLARGRSRRAARGLSGPRRASRPELG